MFYSSVCNQAITRGLTIHTSNVWGYIYLDDKGLCIAKTGLMMFSVRSGGDVHITLSNDKTSESNIEIVIGGWGNGKSVIRRCHHCPSVTSNYGSGRLSSSEFRHFWITWSSDGTISVGSGSTPGESEFMSTIIQQTIDYVGITTGYDSSGEWNICK